MTVRTQLASVQEFEKNHPDQLWFTQPLGGDKIKTFTFSEALDEARRMAAHIKSLELPEKSRIALFSKNTAWWMIADLAIWLSGHITVPLYPTLTSETIRQILEHSEAELIFIGKLDGYKSMAPGIPEGMRRIALPLSPKVDAPKWNDIVEKTEPLKGEIKRDPKDLATIIYTSGSTGVPKGVMHSFESMSIPLVGFEKLLQFGMDDRMLSYLPLAHAFERTVVETGTFLTGFQVYFAESLETFVQDLRRARPTLFVSVPRLWQKFQMGVFSKMPPQRLDLMLKIPVLRGIIRKKVLAGLGLDAVKYAASGSAPIPAELIDWYRSLGLELLEGYGMTENFSYSHATRPGEVRPGYVGSPMEGVECKLSDAGEILVKSPGNMLGYYKAPELTAEVLGDDGWLSTGDRGEIDEKGRLRITGRVKELFKTSKGKYVAPAPIENKLQLHNDIEISCVTGDGFPQPYAMVVLGEATRPKIKDEAEKKRVDATLQEHIKQVNSELDQHEQLGFVVVVGEDWTIENGLLTPTMKLKRGAIEDKYKPKAESWSKHKELVIWD
ncbi:MAG TPA: AMP-binding protein [Polyangiaceae bacterium]|nr:AMP-binding protein [Polyangiaceae bacterium]